jgi:hypothetical protein
MRADNEIGDDAFHRLEANWTGSRSLFVATLIDGSLGLAERWRSRGVFSRPSARTFPQELDRLSTIMRAVPRVFLIFLA